ncbi:MAG: tetraacyldisaccharide 4'-kinase [Planctomycetaceae bacterium TMED138]|nr:MAG: tetraacyldisaccharide 4'-kinase [Planctomycetaceae bacterium TMED138]
MEHVDVTRITLLLYDSQLKKTPYCRIGPNFKMLPDAESFRRLVDGRATGLVATLGRTGLSAIEIPYEALVRLRNYGYDHSILTVKKASAPVISVGNLTLGGTGKTPLVAWLAHWFAQHNKKPAIISRGYKAKTGQLSDEAAELKILLPTVPHYANKQRIIAAGEAVTKGSDVLLLDDGFQHRQISRDLNLITIDATDPFGCNRIFPRGLLREPLWGLKRADALVLTRTDQVSIKTRNEIQEQCFQFVGSHDKPWIETEHRPSNLRLVDGTTQPLKTLQDKRILSLSAIGNPGAFHRTLTTLGHEPVATLTFPDHHTYTTDDIHRISEETESVGAEIIVTTLKDLVKLPLASVRNRPLCALEIGIQFQTGLQDLEYLLNKIP